MEITALFENVDFADCALVRMRDLGINVKSYRTRQVKPGTGDGGGNLTAMFSGGIMPTYGSMGFGASPSDQWMPAAVSTRDYSADNKSGYGSGGEVVLLIIVPDDQTAAAKHALTANHGRRVKTVGNPVTSLSSG